MNNMNKRKLSRRKFIGEASCAALGSTTLFSSILNLGLLNTAAAQPAATSGDYKALVCILLAGGNDSYNMLVPMENGPYIDYSLTRSNLALPYGSLLPINQIGGDGRLYGVHPSMPEVQQLFEQEKLAFLSNIGTLVEPIQNYDEYRSGLKKLPLGLYSHSDQIEQWQTSVPQDRNAIGWGGRMADILQDMNSLGNISMNISLSGRNVFQSGANTIEYTISNSGNGSEGLESFAPWISNSGFLNRLRKDAVESLMEETYQNIFQSTFGKTVKQSFDAQEAFASAIGAVPPIMTPFEDHYLAQNLHMVARTIAAREAIGANRQTFFMTFGGWDHHNEVLDNQLYMLGVVSRALNSFYNALKEIGMENDVTTFTISDFARTLTTNGNGSDHSWGGNQLVMGGMVNGQRIYGQYPSLKLDNNPLNVSNRGTLIPTTSTDAFFAELALWFGVSPNDLSHILPNIGNFYSPGSSDMPLGFLTV